MCDRVGDDVLARAVATLPRLHVLECYGMLRLKAPMIASEMLRHVVLSGCRGLCTLALRCPRLERLELQSCAQLQSESVQTCCRACPRLSSLNLAGCLAMDRLHFACHGLISLVLDGCTRLEHLVIDAPRLAVLSMRDCGRCSQSEVEHIAQQSWHLKSIDLRGCTQIRHPKLAADSLHRLLLHWHSRATLMPTPQSAAPCNASRIVADCLCDLHEMLDARSIAMHDVCAIDSNVPPTYLPSSADTMPSARTSHRRSSDAREVILTGALMPAEVPRHALVLSALSDAAREGAPLGNALRRDPQKHPSRSEHEGEHCQAIMCTNGDAVDDLRASVYMANNMANTISVSSPLLVNGNAVGSKAEWPIEAGRVSAPRDRTGDLHAETSLYPLDGTRHSSLNGANIDSSIDDSSDPAIAAAPPKKRLCGEPSMRASQTPNGQGWSELGSLTLTGAAIGLAHWWGISRHLRACVALHTLNLVRCDGLTDSCLVELLACCPQLRALTLSRLPLASPKIASDSLCNLSLVECEKLTSPEMKCPQLAVIRFTGSQHLRTPLIASNALGTLNLKDCGQLSDLSLCCPVLYDLDLSCCALLPAEAIHFLVRGVPHLHTLRLSGCRALRALSLSSTSLRILHICWCMLLRELVLEGCTGLTTLYAYGCSRLSAPAMAATAIHCVELQKCATIADEPISRLCAGAPQMQLLNLTDCKALLAPRIVATQLRVLHLYNCTQLQSLSLQCAALELLNLTHCVELACLAIACPRLVTLLCGGCKRLPNAAMLDAIRSCPVLQTLDVQGCSLLAAEIGL